MAEFNYTIPIPQPNTNMFGGGFFQGLQAIEGIRSARAQQALEQQLAPLRLQEAELGVRSRRQQMEQSEAAATREASRFQDYTAQREADRALALALSEGKSPTEITKLLPFASAELVAKFPQIAQANMAARVGPIIQQGGPKSEEDVQAMKDAVSTSLMLAPERSQMFQKVFAASSDPIKTSFVKEVMSIGSAGLKGDNETALKKLSDYSTALSANPETKQLGEMLKQKLDEAKIAEKQGLLDKTSWFIDISNLAQSLDPQAAKQFDDLADNTFKFTEAETKIAERKQKMQGGVDVKELPMGLQKIVNEGADNSETFTNLADKADSLAKSLEGMRDKLGGGFLGRGKEALKAGVGAQDEVSAAIKATEALLNEDALARFKKVTSGAISDRETRTALGANPSVYGNPENTIEYLRALSNGAARAAKYEEAKSDWVSKFGTLTAAKQDTSIGDLSVKKGETFSEFRKRLAADLGRKKFYGAGSIDEQNDAERAKESRRVQQGPPPDFKKLGEMQEVGGVKFQLVE